MTKRLTIALIYGSGREGRFADTIAAWLEPELAGFRQYTIVRVDPAELTFTPGGLDAASAEIVESRIAQADAFLVVTPEYNHAYPAALKAIIDSCFRPWHAKPVAFISYGGVSGGLRAVEQLRLVFAELHAVAIRETVSLADVAREKQIILTVDEIQEAAAAFWREHGLRPEIAFRTRSVESVRSLVATGAGVAVLPDLIYRPWSLEGDRIEARPTVEALPPVRVGAVWRRGSRQSDAARMFLDVVLQRPVSHRPNGE